MHLLENYFGWDITELINPDLVTIHHHVKESEYGSHNFIHDRMRFDK